MSRPGERGVDQAPKSSELRIRVLSAVVLIIVALLCTWAGGFWFRLLSVVIGGAIFYEWDAMAADRTPLAHRVVGSVLMGLLLLALLMGLPVLNLLVAVAAVLVAAAAHAFYVKARSWITAGIAYAGLSAISLAAVRGADDAGLVAALFLFAVVWATDIFAYFVGRSVGGPKLAPSISPGKTRSGAVGGAFAGVAAGLVIGVAADASGGVVVVALSALALSIVSQAGDLLESALKRRYAVKDSSRLIPGHGGVMDRVDGLVAAAFAFLVVGSLAGDIEMPAHALFLP